MNQLPFISCKCITYGRVEFLEEAIESFLRQKYDGKKELVIVNDYPLQKLVYDHPEIKIFNLCSTFATIGDKENFAVSQCEGEIIAVWDDDDLALPNHLENIATYFTKGTDLLHWNNGIFMMEQKIIKLTSLGNSGICYSKQIWQRLGGHYKQNAGYDMTFVLAIQDMGANIVRAIPPDNKVSWVYTWGGGSYHMSGQGTDTDDRPNVLVRHAFHIENLRIQGKIPTGKIHLSPNWKHDYVKMLSDYILTI